MISAIGWILVVLVLIAAAIGLVTLGVDRPIAVFAIVVAFILGLDRLHRWRSKRLARSIMPGETLVASGLVSESTYDETPAILVRRDAGRYRIHVSDSRGSKVVNSVGPELTYHTNVNDRKGYIELHADPEVVHFAPRKGILVAAQPSYAQEVLAGMVADGVPPAG